MPLIAGRILRALTDANLIGPLVGVVGTNALYAYERLAGVQIAGAQRATGDIDLLYDARRSLKLIAPEASASGVLGQLRKIDHSFEVVGQHGFRAANRDGYLVDLIMPAGKDPIRPAPRNRIGTDPDDLEAVEIKGLAWRVNSPKAEATVIDVRGYPLRMSVADPRAFALQRDAAQAELVASLVRTRMRGSDFDDPALTALPRALRARAHSPDLSAPVVSHDERRLEPDW